MSYAKALQKLRAHGPQRLIGRWYDVHGDHSALGVLVPALASYGDTPVAQVVADEPKWEDKEGRVAGRVERALLKLDLTVAEAAELQLEVDRFGEDPDDYRWPVERQRARWCHALTWLEGRAAR